MLILTSGKKKSEQQDECRLMDPFWVLLFHCKDSVVGASPPPQSLCLCHEQVFSLAFFCLAFTLLAFLSLVVKILVTIT